MQAGRGKQGILIGEYEGPIDQKDQNKILGWIEPAGDKPQWIIWFTAKGDLTIYTKRSYENGHTGAVEGDPITVRAHPQRNLFLNGKATDHIWAMEDVPGYIGLRMDCGDSGAVYMTPKQAEEVIETLQYMLKAMPKKS
jgi:hypothetical protein